MAVPRTNLTLWETNSYLWAVWFLLANLRIDRWVLGHGGSPSHTFCICRRQLKTHSYSCGRVLREGAKASSIPQDETWSRLLLLPLHWSSSASANRKAIALMLSRVEKSHLKVTAICQSVYHYGKF